MTMSAMTDEQIAADLANVGCSCDNDGAGYCPFLVGHCRKQEKAIYVFLTDAIERGRQAGLREAAEIAKGVGVFMKDPQRIAITAEIRARIKEGPSE
jgi:hypothetical protein